MSKDRRQGTRYLTILLLAGVICLPALAQDLPEPVASYRIEARLDPDAHRIDGRQRLTWTNRTAHPATELRFHLYLNAFRNSASTWLRGPSGPVETLAEHGWGWIEIDRLALAGGPASGSDLAELLEPIAPDDGNEDDRTVARLPLGVPVAPGATIEIDIEFTAQLPRAVARTGFKNDFHLVAQWFPKIGVLRPDGSWSCHQFHRSSEFFADFGDYDVALTVPREFVVGATGRRVETVDGDDGTLTHRYRQAGVHDFAWTAWPDFVEERRTFRHPGLPEVEVILLVRPEARHLIGRYAQALEHALRLFGTWYGPYPYPTLTMVDPAWGARATGGMEYPTFITTGASILHPLAIQRPEGVTVHEFGHQYWYGLIATNELEESFLDEGINTYSTARVLREAYGPRAWSYPTWGLPIVFPGVSLEHPLDTSARFFRRPTVDPIARTAWGYLDRRAYGALTYSKMSLLMEQVERTIGSAAMGRGMRRFAERYRFRHPRTRDLVDELSRAAGRDLSGLFRQTLAGSDALDYSVDSVASRRRRPLIGIFGEGDERELRDRSAALGGEDSDGTVYESEVVVRRLGGVRVPLTTELRFVDGRTARLDWDGEERWIRYRVRGPRLSWAEADPDEFHTLDVDRLNNSRRIEADRRGARRWLQRLRFWLQNLLETGVLLS